VWSVTRAFTVSRGCLPAVPVAVVLVGLAIGAQVCSFAVFPAARADGVAGVLFTRGQAWDNITREE